MYNQPPPSSASPSHSPAQRPPGTYPVNIQHPPMMHSPPEPATNGYAPQPQAPPPPSAARAAGRFFDPISDSRPSRPPPSPNHSHPHQSPLPPHPPIDRRPYEREHPSPGPLTYQQNPATPSTAPAPALVAQHQPVDHLSSPQSRGPAPGHLRNINTMTPQSAPGLSVDGRRRPSSSRVDNPMSFSSILSSNEPSFAAPTDRKPFSPPTAQSLDVDSARGPAVRAAYPSAALPPSIPATNGNTHSATPYTPSVPIPAEGDENTTWSRPRAMNGVYDPIKSHHRAENQTPVHPSSDKPHADVSDKDLEKALSQIEAMEVDEVEVGAYYDRYKSQYKTASIKRLHALDHKEIIARKRRRIAFVKEVNLRFSSKAEAAKEHYNAANRDDVYNGVIAEDMARDKERKKINQRTRRREVQKARHEAQVNEFLIKAEQATTMEEKAKMIQQASKFERKARHTEILLNGEDVSETRDATPAASTLGGILGSFPISEDGQETPSKSTKKARTGRLKKSKEQKQAEKESAAAAHAAMERGDEPIMIAPKGELKPTLGGDLLDIRDSTPADKPLSQVSVKAYDTVFKSVWKEISKDLRAVTRAKTNSWRNKEENLRKTALLASKEARRWQLKTNKSQKEQQARAKRAMREMLGFWKRNEREERDMRKMAEKQELENAKKAEADREANRQKRKLNFLISQTELYSHFIGKKVRTDEAEDNGGEVAASGQTVRDGPAGAHTINLPNSVANPDAKVTNFEDLDFDAEDETALQAAAMANAQNAVKEAQDRARAFNNQNEEQSVQSQLDEMDGEMNFQNPTSLQSMDIAQPKLLSCQLKEYQLKGLNWLVNLYEQGINGILADEMGLGKTVQSISVMAYLAQVHNIWGPFLVIAPSSTLHNWQQEITRFVPDFKVLPYWGNAKDRKVLRKIWDRKHITYTKDAPFHVLITSYQLVVQDSAYLQKMKWQYMILDEAQAIKSSQSSRWKHLLSFHCRNRLLLTGTPIQNNMQELWALLHFIMPSLFDSHDEFSDWFSKDIESHAQSNTKLNEDQLKRLHMILKPFMLRRIKKHVQKELGDKVELDVFCDLTYRQRAFYVNLRNKISILDLIEKATVGDNEDTATLMNLVMQFRKVCNHPDLFERADTTSPVAFSYFAETASFMREGHNVDVLYSVRSPVELCLPKLVARDGGRVDIAGPDNDKAGWRSKYLHHMMNVWDPSHIHQSTEGARGFSWLPLLDVSANQASDIARKDVFGRALVEFSKPPQSGYSGLFDDAEANKENASSKSSRVLAKDDLTKRSLLNIVSRDRKFALPRSFGDGALYDLTNVSRKTFADQGLNAIEPCSRPSVQAPPVELSVASQGVLRERERTFFNVPIRRALFDVSTRTDELVVDEKIDPRALPPTSLLPEPLSAKSRYTHIEVPSMRRFVTDSGKLAKLDELLKELKAGGHRVLLYFQMTRMIDLMEEYLTYRNYKYCRLDGSTKLEDRRDTVADFQQNPEIFVFLLSTRAGGLGINLTAADTVIFYDSDWNPTIDSQAMDRAHRLGQTRQVTVYRLITRNTIEERIRRRALQKEEVQRVVISGGAGATVDFNNRSQRENRTKDIAMWLADDDQAAEIERAEQEMAEREAREGPRKPKKKAGGRVKEVSLDDMYHEGEGNFDDGSKGGHGAPPAGASGDSTPAAGKRAKGKGLSKKAKSQREKLAIIDGTA